MPTSTALIPETLARSAWPSLVKEFSALHVAGEPVLWLVPNRWAKDTILQEWLKHEQGVFDPPIQTIDDFVERLTATTVQRESRSIWQVYDLLMELQKHQNLPYYRTILDRPGFITSVLGFFNELSEQAISWDVAESAFRMARTPKREDLARLCEKMRTTIVERSQVWNQEAYRKATEVVDGRGARLVHAIKKLIVSGFQFFRPRERQLIDALIKKADQSVIVLLADPGSTRPTTFAESKSTWLSFLAEDKKKPSATKSTKTKLLDRPAGIAHLADQLFREKPTLGKASTGIHLIKGPGVLGESRLIARQIRRLINDGVSPDSITITGRNPSAIADVLTDVLTEYQIPFFIETEDSLSKNPAIRTLLRAAQLAQEDWPFDAVTALLRSNYFRPNWESATADIPRHAESLIRQLGEPRGRDAYLRATEIWAQKPPEALEDEQAEHHRRRRKSELAKKCQPFLMEFFQQWEGLPKLSKASEFARWLEEFAKRIGLSEVAVERLEDAEALKLLWKTLADWHHDKLTQADFWKGLSVIVRQIPTSYSQYRGNQVRILEPESAIEVPTEYLFIVGLGEKSFPNIAPPESLLDEVDRSVLRNHGLRFPDRDLRLAREQRLFLQLVARPTRELSLSYPAVDESGQELLPGSYLRSVLELFPEKSIRTTHQRMLIEGYLTQEVLSDSEYRVQWADRIRQSSDDAVLSPVGLPSPVVQNLRAAKELVNARFQSPLHNEFTGMMGSEKIQQQIRERFSSNYVFSPTALETYVACPFKFWLQALLKLEDLEEPGEEVEHTRRGAAYHRALSWLHRRIKEKQPELTRKSVPESLSQDLVKDLTGAIKQYIERAPSEVSKILWELEGERLKRSVAKYPKNWNEYLEVWHKEAIAPTPHLFEADFGLSPTPGTETLPALTISVDGQEVRIGGRIDRVDVAELPSGEVGFWIIDYKTGKRTSYSASAVKSMEKLQLPLYAMAVQDVFLNDQKARPLGLAYWLVTDNGIKLMLPSGKKNSTSDWFKKQDEWTEYRKLLESWIVTLAQHIRDAKFPLAPRSEHCTSTCSFSQVCRIAQSRQVEKDWKLPLPMLEQETTAITT